MCPRVSKLRNESNVSGRTERTDGSARRVMGARRGVRLFHTVNGNGDGDECFINGEQVQVEVQPRRRRRKNALLTGNADRDGFRT